jgi:hypothetical protein
MYQTQASWTSQFIIHIWPEMTEPSKETPWCNSIENLLAPEPTLVSQLDQFITQSKTLTKIPQKPQQHAKNNSFYIHLPLQLWNHYPQN